MSYDTIFYIIATGADYVGTWRAMSDCCGEQSDGDYPDVARHVPTLVR